MFAFVGRITTQKGVHLILEVADAIIHKYQHKVQFLVGGPANMRDPYSARCANHMRELTSRYPECFWAAPSEFFTDGACVNRGADFGLMPSAFEPGGIVQHEFFVGSTPVVAFKTGGLKDSVIEFQWDSETGCGFTFESYKKEDLIFAIERAIGTYKNKAKYTKLRENAFNATMPGEVVSKAWLTECFRLRDKTYFCYDTYAKSKAEMKACTVANYKPINIVAEMFGQSMTSLLEIDDIDFGATDHEAIKEKGKIILSDFDKQQNHKISHTFMMHNKGPRHQKV